MEYTFNGSTVTPSGATPSGFENHGTWIVVPTTLGGTLTFYFATTGINSAGSWSYLTGDSGGESFTYTLVDGDGDTASANLVITITNATLISSAVDPIVLDLGAMRGSQVIGRSLVTRQRGQWHSTCENPSDVR